MMIDVIPEEILSKINLNENDYNNIKQNMKPIIPLKPIVNIKNKECKLFIYCV